MQTIIGHTDEPAPKMKSTVGSWSAGFILRKLVWCASLVGMVFGAASGLFSFHMAESAPQQGAAAAI
ncbi:MAG TPA: hypothetical protein VNJ04_08090, partial [Gemmatimonadaceae bacterium]|nr:hypothetical protein [Gemmatimonadaceae bacterium]